LTLTIFKLVFKLVLRLVLRLVFKLVLRLECKIDGGDDDDDNTEDAEDDAEEEEDNDILESRESCEECDRESCVCVFWNGTGTGPCNEFELWDEFEVCELEDKGVGGVF
jgi:hypothetical protein